MLTFPPPISHKGRRELTTGAALTTCRELPPVTHAERKVKSRNTKYEKPENCKREGDWSLINVSEPIKSQLSRRQQHLEKERKGRGER